MSNNNNHYSQDLAANIHRIKLKTERFYRRIERGLSDQDKEECREIMRAQAQLEDTLECKQIRSCELLQKQAVITSELERMMAVTVL